MTLDLGNESNWTPYIRWMASVQIWRENGADGPREVEIENVVIDLENIKQGWGRFAEGEAPEWIWDNGKRAPRPTEDHKRGFSVVLFSPRTFGDDAPSREWSSTATGAIKGLESLYAEFELKREDNPGKLPVVAYLGSTAVRVGKGNTSIPNFQIVDWTDRPDGLPTDDDDSRGEISESHPQPTHF